MSDDDPRTNPGPELVESPRHRVDPAAEAMTGRYALVVLDADADSPTDYHVRNFMPSEAEAYEQAALLVSGDEPRAAMAWVMEVRGAFVQSSAEHLDHAVAADGHPVESFHIPLDHARDEDEA